MSHISTAELSACTPCVVWTSRLFHPYSFQISEESPLSHAANITAKRYLLF